MKCEICNELFVHSDKQEEICPDCEQEIKEGTESIFLLPDEAAIVFRNDGKIQLIIPGDSDEKTYSDLSDAQLAADVTELILCDSKSLEILNETIQKIKNNIK